MKLNALNAVLPLSFVAALCFQGCAYHSEDTSAEKTEPYKYALASPGSRFGALPPAVQNTVRAEAGSAEITEVLKAYRPEGPVFIIRFRNEELFPPMFLAPDGSLLRPDLSVAVGAPTDTFGVISSGPVTGVKITELPQPAINAIGEHAPNVPIAFINKETWGNRAVFIVSFADTAHHPRLYVAADGKILNEGPK
jgi:hypothetical protein